MAKRFRSFIKRREQLRPWLILTQEGVLDVGRIDHAECSRREHARKTNWCTGVSLPTLLRFKSKEGDMRLYYADAFERSPWKGRLVGGLAILWGLLFVALMANMLLHPGQ